MFRTFTKLLANILGIGKWMKGNFSNVLGNVVDKYAGTGMTDADKEAANMQLEHQQILNEQEFQRKIDFYEMYESPQAQVRQLKSAGLNPALMYSGAPSVSASGGIGSPGSASASASQGDLSGLLSAVVGSFLQSKQLQLQDKWKERELDMEGERVGIAKQLAQADLKYKGLVSENQEIVNKWTEPLLTLDAKNKQSQIDLAVDELNNNRPVQRLLLKSNISLNEAREGLTLFESKIAEVESKNRQRILQAQANVTELQGALLRTQNQFEASLLQKQLDFATQQVTSLILSNGMSAKDFNYYESNRKFNRWTTAIGTGAKAFGAIASMTAVGGVAGKVIGGLRGAVQPMYDSGQGLFNIPGL